MFAKKKRWGLHTIFVCGLWFPRFGNICLNIGLWCLCTIILRNISGFNCWMPMVFAHLGLWEHTISYLGFSAYLYLYRTLVRVSRVPGDSCRLGTCFALQFARPLGFCAQYVACDCVWLCMNPMLIPCCSNGCSNVHSLAWCSLLLNIGVLTPF